MINFIIDFCILIIVSKCVYSKPNFKLITHSAMFGSFASFITPFCTSTLTVNILKILTSIIMLQILHIHKRQLVLSVALMLVISYIFGGAVLSNCATVSSNGYMLAQNSVISVIIVSIIFTFTTYKLIAWIKSKIITNSNILDTTLVLNSKQLTIKSFIDSGNELYNNNQPVSLIDFNTFSTLTNISISQYLNGEFSSLINPKFIFANTIAGKKKILIFTIDKLIVKNKIYKNVQLGVSFKFDKSKEYKAILNSYFCLN